MDEPILADLRVQAAAHRLAAVPLRDHLRVPGTRHRPRHPEVVDIGGRDHRPHVPLHGHHRGVGRRRGHDRRARAAHLPPTHEQPRLRRHDAARQAHVPHALGRHPRRGLFDDLRLRTQRLRLPRGRVGVVPPVLDVPARRQSHGLGTAGIPDPRHVRDPHLRAVALHPDRPRLPIYKLMYLMLSVVILAGVYSTIFDSALSDYDYREGVSVWFRQFWMFQPDVNLMASAPLGFQIHVMSAILIFALWPFTRIVHVF